MADPLDIEVHGGSGNSAPASTGTYASEKDFKPTIKTTQPPVILRHDISDEQLDMLARGRSDNWYQFMWALVGLVVGQAASAANVFYHAFWTKDSAIDLLGLGEILIFAVGVALAIFSGAIVFCRSRSINSLVKDIRERTDASREKIGQ